MCGGARASQRPELHPGTSAARSEGRWPALSTRVGVGLERTGPLSIPELGTPAARGKEYGEARPMMVGVSTCYRSGAGPALAAGIWLEGWRVRAGLCVAKGLHSPGSPMCKGESQEALLFL